jgi:hypothetical protein
MTDIKSTDFPTLIRIIDESYTDGLDGISSARLNDDGTILAIGMDGAKQIGAKISDTEIKIRILNPEPIDTNSANFSDSNIYEQLGMRLVQLALEEVEFAAPKAKNNGSLKKKTCKTGLSCGGTCISKSKICKRALSIDQQKEFKELKKRLKAGDLGATKGIDALKKEQQGLAEDISIEDLNRSEDMLKKSLGEVTGKKGAELDLAWNKINLNNTFDGDISLDELTESDAKLGLVVKKLTLDRTLNKTDEEAIRKQLEKTLRETKPNG